MHDIGADQPQWMGNSHGPHPHPHAHTHGHPHPHHHPMHGHPHPPHPHMFPQEWTPQSQDGDHLLPSPPITEMSSPGPPGLTLTPPGLTLTPPTANGVPPQPHRSPPQGRSPYDWIKKSNSVYHSQPIPGKTRTKDKYRVVYTDHQRLELEKEFHYSRYITIRRKAELAVSLGLSERQVKIWFQNRRAKERKQMKKREELIHKEKIQQLSLL